MSKLEPVVEDGTVRVPVGEDGHFWVEAEVNGHPLRFMVDSGASVTTVSRDAAAAAGLPIGSQRTIVQTANGPATAIQGSADRFESEDMTFHEGLRAAYRKIAADDPSRCVLIDATPDPDSVSRAIWGAVRERLMPDRVASPA